MKTEPTFPLPQKQYHGYIALFNAMMFGSLAIALIVTLWENRAGLGWCAVVTAVLILIQTGMYVWLLRRKWPSPLRVLLFYYGVCLILWAIEIWLTPVIWWLAFAYVGQMFGLLPLWGALAGTAFVFAGMYRVLMSTGMIGAPSEALSSILAQWIPIVVILVFLNQLIHTSQDRGKLIAKLEAAKKELELAQAREAELAVLRERERLARDLHDSLGHAMVALTVQLEAVQRLYRVDPQRAAAQMDELKTLTRSSMDTLRRSIAGLRIQDFDDRDLCSALQSLCVDFGQRTGLTVTCTLDEETPALSPVLAETVWRVVQEALTNVEKHARADRAAVYLRHEARAVVVRIADNGIGLPDNADAGLSHFGLRGMRERIEGLGGILTLSNDEGAVVEARLPVIGG